MFAHRHIHINTFIKAPLFAGNGIEQLINLSINQQSVTQPISQLVNQLTNQSERRPINELTNQSINQSKSKL